MGGACSTRGERRSAYRVLVGIPEEKRPLGRPRLKWGEGGNIKMAIQDWVRRHGLNGSGSG
jgi:hypothetical protein